MEWMKIVGWIWGVAIVWCVWDFYMTPITPADYNEEGINLDYTEIEDEND
tara:strand:+ start:411 stop:560 length:150 start_codon:yes stop_codon:yes gene_type:complete